MIEDRLIEEFMRDGFVKLEHTVDIEVADAARDLLWERLGLSPDGPWTEPVVWTGDFTGTGPFSQLTRSPVLTDALDRLCGRDGWVRRFALGNIPVRFPVRPGADDRGWHIDANTPVTADSWAVTGRPHTMLLLTLLSEVGPDDAPTRIRVGSHRDVAGVLGPDDPVDFVASGALVDRASAGRPVARATGRPGDMYLVHPFTVHAADEHRGTRPRFMAQTPIVLTEPLSPDHPGPLACAWRQ
ncbi:phytanoyl-CoA dioxygenase family protein [Mycolicibacterium goodii]|uniref:phytanoyl-CoA dioxygenase family protein n=1 Tax=Mycolicibacterium goodii TaxID=134601 RepID=UPI00093BAF5C|nr:phytanoyl-CoA dioxygenase family protein [Mycolicibacterium goodii]MBU8830433.1 phytanoyl-CoA dioxygenase family protein [Mycolicibacterium goodii]OKH64256.1 mitomycin antibiotics/polyketide fumonisin biosynthesis protein [Mycobacterium sp. SWH-M5]ULN49009.1 phytanoyl-CoA dioxygenase family protein [Mycolicibacterium goodii]